jgi:SAM-dependent methyltransferase
MSLGTTTWRQRNQDRLTLARHCALEIGMTRPVLLDYGPGAAVNFLLDCLPFGDKNSWTLYDKIRRGLVKFPESVLRKSGVFSLETSEPEEVAYVFSDLSPQRICVVDKEQRVIDAVRRLVERNGLPVPVEYHVLDLQHDHLPLQGDIVFAYNVAERVEGHERALERIANTTRKGGLLSTTMLSPPPGFEQRAEGLYQRIRS